MGFKLDDLKKTEFHRTGFLVIEKVVSQEFVNSLADECDKLVNLVYQEDKDIIKDFGCILEPFNPWFLENLFLEENIEPQENDSSYDVSIRESVMQRQKIPFYNIPIIIDTILNILAPLAASILPKGNVFLWNEQFIVKPPSENSLEDTKFRWHQDREYLPSNLQNTPTLAIWIPLQGICMENGGLAFKPYDPLNQDILCKELDMSNYQLIHRLLVPAQRSFAVEPYTVLPPIFPESAVLISSSVLHCSLPNLSQKFRRGYMIQFSSCPIPSEAFLSTTLKR